MFSNLLFKLLLIILHFIVDIFEFCRDIWEYLKTNIIDRHSNNYKDLHLRLKTLNKVPIHLTVLLGKENPSYEDLANIVFWSMASGISFISFYDDNGTMKANKSLFQYEVERQKKDNQHIIWHDNFENIYKNGFTGSKIHIKILSPSDGKKAIAVICKELAATEKSANIDVKLVDSYVKKQYEFPDPDLGIYCGRSFSLYDYPPWQIAVTEFLNLKSHHNIKFITFLKILQTFSKCEQRLGK